MVLFTMDDLPIDQLRDLYSAETQLEVVLPVVIDEMGYAMRLDQGRATTLLGISHSEEIAADSSLARLQELEWKDDAVTAGAP